MPRAVGKPSSLGAAALACVGLAALSLLLATGPSYDPYQWLIWGRDLAHLHLDTRGSGTSWKPLPALVAALLSPLRNGQADAWLIVARAGALFGLFMAFRLAARLAGPRWAWPAGLVAAATLALTGDLVRRTAVGHVEALTAALVLLAIDRHLDRRRGQAFAAGAAAALTRPEVWPFLLVYGACLWFARERPSRWALAVGGALVPLLWFGGDWFGSGRLSTASDRALHPIRNSPGVSAHPALAVVQEAWRMLPLPARVALPAAVASALVGGLVRVWRARTDSRRPGADGDGLVLVLAVGALVWTAIVAAMAQRGYPGLPRFLFPADAVAAVLAGVGVARIAALATLPSVRLRPAAAAAALLAFAALAAPAVARLRSDAAAIETVAQRDDGLAEAVAGAGGPSAVLGCGRPYTGWFAVTALAYDLGLQAGGVEDRPHGRRPVVFMLTHGVTGLRSPLPRRHTQRAHSVDGWYVVDRCRALARGAGGRQAPRAATRAGSRRHGRRAART